MDDFFKAPSVGGENAAAATAEKVFTVTEFNTQVNQLLNQFVVTVQGEVSGYKVIQDKYVRFDLKDKNSVMGCFLGLWQLQLQIEDGMEIKVRGRPGLYVPQGRYTFRVDAMEPVGEGALKRAFELTRAKLEKQGLFDPKYKKPLPRFPATLGIVTSTDAAAYTDVLKILNNRWGGLEIYVYNARVQGADSVPEVVSGLEYFNKHQPVDVLILTRGGGSLEDLQSFNSEQVCRAVFASKIPVICGIGHERDLSLAELVADQRASTPTNAAQLAVPDKAEILGQLKYWQSQMHRDISNQLQRQSNFASGAVGKINNLVLGRISHFQEVNHRLSLVGQQFHNKLNNYRALLQSLNPLKILSRGYSVTYDAKGNLLRSSGPIKNGQVLKTRFADGQVQSKVFKQMSLI